VRPYARQNVRSYVRPYYYGYSSALSLPYGYGGGYGYDVGGGFDYGYGSSRGFGYDYGGGYGPYGYPSPGYVVAGGGPGYGGVRIDLEQRDAEVFVDGYYVGIVDDFDGALQRLDLEPAAHRIELRAPGFETSQFEVNIVPGQTIRYRTPMRPLP
jgi:hypothetical protein